MRRSEAQHNPEFLEKVCRPLRKIARARICAPNVRAKRTPRARWIFIEREMIFPNLLRVAANAGNGFDLRWYQWIACARAANNFRTELIGFGKIPAALFVNKSPELSDILLQLPNDQIG